MTRQASDQRPQRRASPLLTRCRAFAARHWPILFFSALALLFLWPALFGDRALLPTGLLMEMSPWAQPAAPGATPPPALPWNPILWDAIAQFYPWRAFAAHWMHRGIIPLWDPHQFCGTPFLANSQSAVLYPLHLLLLDLPAGLPVARAMALLAALHLTLAGFLTHLWLRALHLSRFAALLGGVTFMLAQFNVTWLELPSFLTVACWLPALFLTLHRLLEAPSFRRSAALALAVGLTLLGGHLQIAFYSLLGAGLFAVWELLRVERVGCGRPRSGWMLGTRTDRTDQSDPSKHGEPNLQRFPLLVLALVLGGMLAAPQILPAVELSHLSHRVAAVSASGYAAYVRGAMPAAQLVRLFLPDFLGNPTRGDYIGGSPADFSEFAASFGAVGLLLALAALLAWRRRPRRTLFAALLAALALLLALGTPLDALFYFGIPGFSQSGSPARALILFAFAGAWLVGLGAQALTERSESDPSDARQAAVGVGLAEVTRYRRPGGLALAAFVVWLVIFGITFLIARQFVEARSPDFSALLARNEASLRLVLVLALLAAALPAGLQWLGAGEPGKSGAASGSVTGSPDALPQQGPAPGSSAPLLSAETASVLARVLLAALLIGEVWLNGSAFNPTGPLSDLYPPTPLLTALRSGPAAGSGRLLPINHHWSLYQHPHAVLPPNSALALGLTDPQGYDSLFIGRYKALTDLIAGRDSAPVENGNMLFVWNPSSPLLPLLGADRVVTPARGPDMGSDAGAALRSPAGRAPRVSRWPLLYQENGLEVRRCPDSLPRAFIAPGWRPVSDADAPAALQRLAAAHALGKLALVAAPAATRNASGAGALSHRLEPVSVQEVSPNELRLAVAPPTALTPGGATGRTGTSMLVILDNDYPGWRATDAGTGRPLPLHRVDLTFRGVELPPGTTEVRLRFEPASFRFGLYLALLALGAMAGLAVGWGTNTETRRHGEE